jgi:hypothetical protein
MEQTMIKRVRTTPTKRSKQSSTMTLKASGHSKKENSEFYKKIYNPRSRSDDQWGPYPC